MLNRVPLFLVFIVAIASAAGAQHAGPPTDSERWRAMINESSDKLKSADYAGSLKISEKVIREMIERLGPGEAATQAFGIVVSHKALALAGLGREEDALWYWHTVLTLYPPFAKSDLSGFGKAGEFLALHRQPRSREEETGEKENPKEERIQPPRVRKRVEPEFARGALLFGAQGPLIVELMITKEGKVTAPYVLQPLSAPTLTYTSLEALRKWRFAPGRLNGEPVEVVFNMTINFKQ